jgi:hypothetical protein
MKTNFPMMLICSLVTAALFCPCSRDDGSMTVTDVKKGNAEKFIAHAGGAIRGFTATLKI